MIYLKLASRSGATKLNRLSVIFYKSNSYHVLNNYKSSSLLLTQSSININKFFLSSNKKNANNNFNISSNTTNTKIEWLPTEIIDPMLNPTQKSAIADPNSLLSAEEKQVIEGYLNCIKKAQIGVLIISRINKEYIK